jgi:hypothetical protein
MRNVKTKILNQIFYLLEIKLSNTVDENVETELANDVRENLLITYPQLIHITKENLKL